MKDRFIERGTEYSLSSGKLTVYETNCACKNIQFHFDQYLLTLMTIGHKSIVSKNLKLEFFPGTFFIPEKEVINYVAIPNATLDNPTRCLVLEVDPQFVKNTYDELLLSDTKRVGNYNNDLTYFLSNDQHLINAYIRLYDIVISDHSKCKALIEDLIIKEILYRLYLTDGFSLLLKNTTTEIKSPSVRKAVSYIKENLSGNITMDILSDIANVGRTTLYKNFKNELGLTPNEYLMNERIYQAQVMIKKKQSSLKEIAHRTGFNSYEYFCSCFKKITASRPSEYKNAVLNN